MTPCAKKSVLIPVPCDALRWAEDGFEDYVGGKLRGQNPFPPRSPCFLQWDQGWLEARSYIGA